MEISTDVSARPSELSRALESTDLKSALQHIAEACAALVPGTMGASVTLWRDGEPFTFASSRADVEALDTAQYDAMSGPCVDAAQVGKAFVIDDTSTETRWPAFTSTAVEQGIKSSLSLPLIVGGSVIGSLNLYGSEAFTEQAQELAELVAAHGGSVTLASSALFDARQLAEDLQTALTSRATIDRAIGIVMVQQRLGEDAAFDVLVKASQRSNRKLRDVAAELVKRVGGS